MSLGIRRYSTVLAGFQGHNHISKVTCVVLYTACTFIFYDVKGNGPGMLLKKCEEKLFVRICE